LIMLITAQGDQANRILGLDAGADDYMIKPFDPEEVAARVRALQRRGSSSSPVLEIGFLRLDPARREITYRNQPLNFRPKEYALLELLLRNPQRVFSRREILDRLWAVTAEPPDEATIKAHVKGVRQVLRKVGAEDLIKTVYGQGYHLDPSVLATNPSVPDNPHELVSDIWEQVKNLTFDRLAVIKRAIAAFRSGELPPELREEAARNAHRLVGALGMFGFAEAFLLAQHLEQLFAAEEPLTLAQILTAERWLLDLERQVREDRRSRSQTTPVEDLAPALPIAPTAKVLAIDDDAALLNLLQELMLPLGVEIVPLTSTQQLWENLTHVQPDLILLDILMPDVDGVELCRTIRTSTQWKWVPIVFLTVCRDADTQVRVFEVGADDYLWKPFAPSVLATRILNRVSRFKTIQQRAIAEITQF
jgi:DNA-binding response OmpR family regulator